MTKELRQAFPGVCFECPSTSDAAFAASAEDLELSAEYEAITNEAAEQNRKPEAVQAIRGLQAAAQQRAGSRLQSCEPGPWTARSEQLPRELGQQAICGKTGTVHFLFVTRDHPQVTITRKEE